MNRMGNHLARRVVCTTIILFLTGVSPGVEFAGGTGEPDDPYQIATAEQLIGMGRDPNLYAGHFVLTADIDLDPNLPGGQVFSRSVIASYGPQPPRALSPLPPYGSFEGVFDGGGHVIRNMVILAENESMAGLFGHVSATGEIRDLGLEGVSIQRSVAGGQAFAAGGLAAVNEGGTILRCYARGAISGPERIGMPGGKGEVTALAASGDEIGGLVGVNRGLINTSYALVDVSGTGAIGGLIGQNSQGLVYFSFSAGRVRGLGWPGGLVGRSETRTFSRAGEAFQDDPGTAIRCFWDIQASGMLDSAAGEGRTTAEMMSRRTYVSWTHTGVWELHEDFGYPRFLWEPEHRWGRGSSPYWISTGQFGYGGGNGEPNDPYRIQRVEQFLTIGCHPEDFDKSFVLTADLDFTGVDQSQALTIGFDRVPFNGRFDGGSHVLSNLMVLQPRALGVGVFGLVGDASVVLHNNELDYEIRDNGSYSLRYTGNSEPPPTSKSIIKNLHLHNVTVIGRQNVGGLIGLGPADVTDCSVSGQITGLTAVGGLVGRSLGGVLSKCRADVQATGDIQIGGLVGATGPALNVLDCQADGTVAGQLYTGGLIGYSQRDTISRCAARVDVHGRYHAGGCLGSTSSSTVTQSYSLGAIAGDRYVGGFVGGTGGAMISDSYCRANVTGVQLTGGFAGSLEGFGRIDRCYAVSTVKAGDPIPQLLSMGGFIGYASTRNAPSGDGSPANVTGCFWDTDVSGMTSALGNRLADSGNVAGLPSAQMQTAATFTTTGWDLASVWMVCEDQDYPRLRWEPVRCEEKP